MFCFIKRVIRKLYYLPKALIGNLIFGANKVLNDGERFDPFLSSFQYADKCHLPRYEFAKTLIGSSDEVVDIACGTGYGSRMLAPVAKKVTGVDISPEAIAYANEKCDQNNLFYVESDFFKNTVMADVAVSFETIEHLKVDDFPSILHALTSFARRRVVGSIPYMEKEGSNPHHFFFNLNEQDVQVLKEYGDITFYYQTADGNIISEKPDSGIQNLIIVLEKKQA